MSPSSLCGTNNVSIHGRAYIKITLQPASCCIQSSCLNPSLKSQQPDSASTAPVNTLLCITSSHQSMLMRCSCITNPHQNMLMGCSFCQALVPLIVYFTSHWKRSKVPSKTQQLLTTRWRQFLRFRIEYSFYSSWGQECVLHKGVGDGSLVIYASYWGP